MRALHMITFALLVIGGLNWGLMLFDLDIATWGLPSGLIDTVYALVALSALYEGATHMSRCKECRKEMTSGM